MKGENTKMAGLEMRPGCAAEECGDWPDRRGRDRCQIVGGEESEVRSEGRRGIGGVMVG